MLSENMEKDIKSLVDVALSKELDCDSDLETSKELFIATLNKYSVLRQTPKFFVKLLLGVVEAVQNNTKGLKKGQIIPSVLQACAECINELPPGQTFELWEIFVETFSTLRKIVLSSPKSFGALFYVCQLFQTFLLNARIFDSSLPTNSLLKMETMMQLTNENLKEMSSILKKTDSEVIPCQLCLLMICYAIGEVKIAYNVTNSITKLEASNFEIQILDFSPLHPFLNGDVATVFSSFLEHQNKSRLYYLIQLLIQKVRVLMLMQNTEEHLQLSIAFVIEIMTSLDCDANKVWNTDLSTLGVNNYGTALWSTFIKILPVIARSLNNKQASSLCDSMADVLLITPERLNIQNEIDARSLICYFLKSEFLKESTNLQTALISSIWKNSNIILKTKKRSHNDSSVGASPQEKVLNELNNYRCKWGKYASTTPKNKNDFWCALTEISTHLTHLLETSEFSKQSLKLIESENILKLLDFLPLEFLLPGNQMRCLFGLSVMFLSLPKSSIKNSEVIQLAEHIGILLTSIFEGVRSVWLFDFINGGLYLKAFIETIDNLKMKLSDKNCNWIEKLLKHIIFLIIKNPEVLKSSEEYFVQLANNMSESISTAKAMSVLLHTLVSQFQRPYLSTIHKDVYKSTVLLVCSCILKTMRNRPDQINKDVYTVLISCYAELIELAISPIYSLHAKDSSKWFKILPDVLETASQQILQKNVLEEENGTYLKLYCKLLSHHKELSVYLPNDFIKVTWRALSCYWESKCEQIKQIRSEESKVSSRITEFKLLRENPQLTFHLCPSYFELDSKAFSDARSIVTLNTSEVDVLSSISKTATESELTEIFQSLEAKIESSSDINAIDPLCFQMTLLITKHLISFAKGNQLSYVSQSIQKILSLLHYIANQTCGSLNCLFHITVPILQFLDFILKINELVLPKQNVLQCLHSCVGINIENMASEPVIFAKLFTAIWNLLHDFLTHHSVLMCSSRASFLSFVSMLLKSVVKAGNQDVLKNHNNDVKMQIVICAQNMDRLLTLISRYKKEFEKLASYLVADYVDSVQHITVYPTVKDHLLLGINRLIAIFNKDAVKMTSVNLNQNCREIYSNLITNYKQYKHYE